MRLKLGILAEDKTDCEVIATLVRRLTPGGSVGIKLKGANGCAKLERKRTKWIDEFIRKGVTHFIVVRDLDRNSQTNTLNDAAETRCRFADFEKRFSNNGVLCIPIEELEAWFWADEDVLMSIASEKHKNRAKAVAHPHSVVKPKEKLFELSCGEGGKPTYSTNRNKELAEVLDLKKAKAKCPELAGLLKFIEALVPEARR